MDKDELYNMLDDLEIERLKTNMRATEITGCCPLCPDSRPSFGVNIQKLLFNCFSCHATGSIEFLVRRVLQVNKGPALEFIAKYGKYSGTDAVDNPLDIMLKPAQKKKEQREAFGEMVSRVMYTPYLISKRRFEAKRYLIHRGVTYKKQLESTCGLDFGYDPKQQRVMFPWYNDKGHFVGCTGRYTGNDKSVFRYMPYFNLEKGQHLFLGCRRVIRKPRKIVIVEGEIDAIRITQLLSRTGIIALALGNSMATARQITLLKDLGGPFILGLDADEYGINGQKYLLQKLASFVPCASVRWPKKDAGDCRDKQISKILLAA